MGVQIQAESALPVRLEPSIVPYGKLPMEHVQIGVNDHTPAEHDFSLLFEGSEVNLLALSPNYFVMGMLRHLPAINAITATKAATAVELSVEAQLEVFALQKLLYDVYEEAFGTRPIKVQPLVLQMSGPLFHVQYWPRYKDKVTILGRTFEDTDFTDRRVVTRLKEGEAPQQMVDDERFLNDRKDKVHDLLRAAFAKVAGV